MAKNLEITLTKAFPHKDAFLGSFPGKPKKKDPWRPTPGPWGSLDLLD
jgi:hypothetical protein